MHRKFSNFQSVAVLLAGLSWAVVSHAQVGSVELVGTARDASGGVVAGVKVTLTNADTGYARTSVTNDEGVFALTSLSAGRYTLESEASGFKRKKIEDIVLTVGQRTRLDVDMEIGTVAEVVDVTSSAPLVETENPTIGGLIESTTILELPLNGRDFMQLALLTGGVNEGQTGGPSSTAPVGAGIPYSICLA